MAPNSRGPGLGRMLDIPVLTDWRSTDSMSVLMTVLQEHERGYFQRSALLVDEMLTDDRIAGVLDTRIGGLLCADMTFKPADDRRKSMKLARILGGSDEADSDGEWLRMVPFETAYTLLKWRIMLGFAVAEITWDTKAGQWLPRLVPWHPRHSYWNWGKRCFQLMTSGPDPDQPYIAVGETQWTIDLPRVDRDIAYDGHWFVWGSPYSWMRGAVRPLGTKFLDRVWNERDWARYCEKHGLAFMEGKVPSGTDVEEKDRFLSDLSNLGNEPTIISPQAPAGEPSYGFQLHEATARTWETYQARKQALDTDIAILLLGQNLTTEVQGGSRSAAEVHENIRIDKKRQDADFFRQVREQVLIPWCLHNFTYPDVVKAQALAPYPQPQISPPDDEEKEANALKLLGEACTALDGAYAAVDKRAILEAHGVPIDEEKAAKLDEMATDPPPPGGDSGAEHGQKDGNGQPPPKAEQQTTAADLIRYATLKAGAAKGPTALRRVAKYHDALTTHARRLAAKALAHDLEAIRDDIDAATDYADLKRRVVRRFKAMKSAPELAGIIERLNVLGNMTGRDDILRGL
jgi:phage gp29-like protein